MEKRSNTGEKLPILITAIGGGGQGEQILKALKMLDRKKYKIVGADVNPASPQFALADERIVLPYANDPSYIEALLSVCAKYGVKALFHGCEAELLQFSSNRQLIESQGIFLPINPESVISTCMNKEESNNQLASLGFDVPRYICVKSKKELLSIDWFPVVVKPSTGSGGSTDVYIAQNIAELLGLADFLGLEAISDNFVIQEYIGTPEEEYTVGVLHDMHGNYINSIALRRLFSSQMNIRMSVPNRTDRKELGKKLVISSGVSHGYIGRYSEVTDQCKLIAKAIGATGPINIQCRLVEGKVRVFEINPRFSGTTSIRAMVGYNEPDVLMRKHLFGEDIAVDFEYEEALILRGLVETKVVN